MPQVAFDDPIDQNFMRRPRELLVLGPSFGEMDLLQPTARIDLIGHNV